MNLDPEELDRLRTCVEGALTRTQAELDNTDGTCVVAREIIDALGLTKVGYAPGVFYVKAAC